MPPTQTARGKRHFHRLVLVLAGLALAFFLPSLAIAGVPQERWLEFTTVASAASVILLGTLLREGLDTRERLAVGLIVGVTLAGITRMDAGYFNQGPLLFAMLVASLSVLQGLRPAFVATAVGAIAIPSAVQVGVQTNATDYVYAFIYLAGAALLPWTAIRVAERRFLAAAEQLERTHATQREALLVLARAAEAKDQLSIDHVANVGELSRQLGLMVHMTDAEADALRDAAMLHDVGKLHVPDQILLRPGKLSARDWRVVRSHTVEGADILGMSRGFELARTVARWHHENWDGTGYPDGLRGSEIPMAARIVRLADSFDALRSPRPYRFAWSLEDVQRHFREQSGRLYDPALVPLFMVLAERWEDAHDRSDLHAWADVA